MHSVNACPDSAAATVHLASLGRLNRLPCYNNTLKSSSIAQLLTLRYCLLILSSDSQLMAQVVEATLSVEVYEHEEDFFFRTVHLGSECWAFVVHNRVAIAQQCAEEGQWNIAAARIFQASLYSRAGAILGSPTLL